MMDPPRKRRRFEGDGEQPLAPPASTALESGARSDYQEGGSSSLLANVPLGKRILEQETNMTDASVETRRAT